MPNYSAQIISQNKLTLPSAKVSLDFNAVQLSILSPRSLRLCGSLRQAEASTLKKLNLTKIKL
ncbi:MAG: hypothetical protein RMZ41_009580 [Nostoc sp. DedVER02]|uniref:hypothetical protein n=1 Tax=unclassified Nostoc TaxID=2593658 RepID=UPI002AD527CC|nr:MULTISPECIES: hypothetical protein [unclassified Nostoc]MDZ7985637.1 hypothetical protein [Nostoc sp. DedVER02]MDZ8111293.1 hypothetical protein [Nostoc sp. DedVER01b]